MKWTLNEAQSHHVVDRLAEFLREIALLWAVFAVLDKFVAEQLTVGWAIANSVGATLVWMFALTLELRRIR